MNRNRRERKRPALAPVGITAILGADLQAVTRLAPLVSGRLIPLVKERRRREGIGECCAYDAATRLVLCCMDRAAIAVNLPDDARLRSCQYAIVGVPANSEFGRYLCKGAQGAGGGLQS
jgi:hypothetical protein